MTKTLLFGDIFEDQAIAPITFNLTLHRLVLHAGGNRDFTPLHYDDSNARNAGARGAFINNVFAIGMWERAAREFVGPGGIIHVIRGLKMSSFNVAGDELITSGHVQRTWTEGGVGFVEIAMETTNTTVGRTTVGPGTILVSVPIAGDVTDNLNVAKRYAAASSASARMAVRAAPAQTRSTSDTWEEVAALRDRNLLKVTALLGADRVEPSVLRRLCEPLELGSPLHYDPATAMTWGFKTVVAPVCGLGTTYVDPGSWHPGEPTQYSKPDRDAALTRPNGVENGNKTTALPVPAGSVAILTEVGLDLEAPIHVGDLLSVRSIRLTRVVPKTTTVGEGAFLTFVNEVWNEDRRIGSITKVQFQYVPQAEPTPNDSN